MKVTDYIIEFLIAKGITDIFGYPGGVICHLMNSTDKYKNKIQSHLNYHEQASSFSACGYAQSSLKPGVVFVTSGPGATNLITGISNAYFDSIPTIFITGQVDTFALKGDLTVRQKGFQETDIVSMVGSVTKYCVRIDSPNDVQKSLEKAYEMAVSGRPGPVLIDLPADIQRSEIALLTHKENKVKIEGNTDFSDNIKKIISLINQAERPCFLLGSGVKQCGMKGKVRELVEKLNIPVVTSLLAFDLIYPPLYMVY